MEKAFKQVGMGSILLKQGRSCLPDGVSYLSQFPHRVGVKTDVERDVSLGKIKIIVCICSEDRSARPLV